MTAAERAALELSKRALARARPGEQAQATVVAERSLLSRFSDSRPTQATALDDLTCELTIVSGGRAASATTNRTDDGALERLAQTARSAVEAASRRGQASHPGLAQPPQLRPARPGADPETAQLDPRAVAEAVEVIFEEAERHRVTCHGVCTSGEVTTAISSSTGVELAETTTDAFVKVTAQAERQRTGYASATAHALPDCDARAVCERAAAKAGVGAATESLAGGRYPVVFEPAAVAELCDWLGRLAFNGLAYAEGRSALCGKLGSRVAGESIQLADSPAHPQTIARSFDFEATPKRELWLLEDGVAASVCHDRKTGWLAGSQSTGHALAPGGAPYGAVPTNLCLSGQSEGSVADLCRPIEHGVYVTRLWYTNPVRPHETLITGLTRDGTFLIQDGVIGAPLADMRLTDSVLSIFSGAATLGGLPELVGEGEFYGRRFASGVLCPALRADAVRLDP